MPGSLAGNQHNFGEKVAAVLSGRAVECSALDPLLDCLRRFFEQSGKLSKSIWWRRFSDDLCRFAGSIHREALIHASGEIPDLSTYLDRRISTLGWHCLVDLIELEQEIELPGEIVQSTEHAACSRAAADVVCGINDLLSLDKELAAGERHNMVLVLRHEYGCGLEEAKLRTRDWIHARLADYQMAHQKFLGRYGADQSLVRYAHGFGNLMRGSLDWSLESGRYRQTSTVSGNNGVS